MNEMLWYFEVEVVILDLLLGNDRNNLIECVENDYIEFVEN